MKRITPSTAGLALAAGLLVLIASGCPGPPGDLLDAMHPDGHVKATTAADELSARVGRDPAAVLQDGLDRYDREVTSYTCTLYQQERVNPKGLMGPVQKMLCKCTEHPFSVCLDAVENPVGARKVLYVEGQWANRMLVRPAGLGSFLGCILIDPHGAQARADSLRSIDQFGFKRNVRDMIDTCTAARNEGILTVRLLGIGAVGGRDVVICEVRMAEPKPTGGQHRFPYPLVRVSIDCQWLLPTAIDLWDGEGLERGHYRYVEVNFNARLAARDFLPEANGMTSPRQAPTTAKEVAWASCPCLKTLGVPKSRFKPRAGCPCHEGALL